MNNTPVEAHTIDIAEIKADFPILNRPINGRELVYLDSASTSQKPTQVLDAMRDFYENTNANVHRGAYFLSDKASRAMEGARKKVARLIGARSADEVIFTKNATEALNLIAASWGRANLQRGDVVVLSVLEHHANIVPWHMLAAERGIELRWLQVGPDGLLDLSNLDELLEGAKLVSVTAMGNVTGALVPVARIAAAAHAAGALCAVDACQLVPHVATNVAELDIDFACIQRPQDVWPDRDWGVVGPQGDSRRYATVPWWWRDDRQCHDRGFHHCRPALQIRSGHATHRRNYRIGCSR